MSIITYNTGITHLHVIDNSCISSLNIQIRAVLYIVTGDECILIDLIINID